RAGVPDLQQWPVGVQGVDPAGAAVVRGRHLARARGHGADRHASFRAAGLHAAVVPALARPDDLDPRRTRRRAVKTLRRYLRLEIIQATGFVLFALLSIFSFFEIINQLDDLGRAGYQLRDVFIYVLLGLPTRTYELMPLAALIGTIYALSKLASNS